MTLISLLFLIFIFSINTIEATGPKDLNPEKTKADANLSQNPEKTKSDSNLSQNPAKTKKDLEKQKQALLKDIILEDVSSSENLTDPDKKYIQDQSRLKDIWIREGLKITVEDDQLKATGALKDFIENPNKIEVLLNEAEFIEKIMEAIKAKHKLTGEYRYSLKKGDSDTGAFEIYFYKNEAKSLKNMIIADLENCRDLEESELQALKNDDKIYDSKYISNACGILIEDRNLASFIEENKVDSFKDTDYKQEIADGLNKANLNLDKHMSVYFKVQDITQGRIGVILADTKRKKKSALIEALKNHLNNSTDNAINQKRIEEAYGVQYLNLGIYLYWADDRFNSGGEFDKSLALIDEILNTDPEIRTAWIDRANEIRCSRWNMQEAFPNDENTIIRSRLISSYYNFHIDIFTLIESPKGAIQANLLNEMDIRIAKYPRYESIKSSDAIKGFEAGRSLKKGLKIRAILDFRLEEDGSLSSYYDNAKEFNPLLDDADFKRKVITKINDYQENNQKFKEKIDFVFSTDNLENIKIKAQRFRDRDKFDLMVYELEPLGESGSK